MDHVGLFATWPFCVAFREDETMVKFKMGLKSCPLEPKVRASADFVKDGGKLGFICNRLVWRTTTELNVAFRLSDMTLGDDQVEQTRLGRSHVQV